MKSGEGEYKYAAGIHRPEYETATSFGALCLNNNTDSIIMANDICNRAGLDTISAGSIIAFAIELYENGILTQKDTDGIDLKWGNHWAIVAMTRKLANREGVGDILANGVKRAAEIIGKGSEQFAMHIGGQEVAMHDPKVAGNWTSDQVLRRATRWMPHPGAIPLSSERMLLSIPISSMLPVFATSGCGRRIEELMVGVFKAVTGWDYSWNDMRKTGETNRQHAPCVQSA